MTGGEGGFASPGQSDANTQMAGDGTSASGGAPEGAKSALPEGVSPELSAVAQTSQGVERKPPFPTYEPDSDFPWKALPETIRGAVLEICKNDKLAVPLAVQATLAAVSLACQDLVLVDRGFGEASVCSLFMLTVADSGARKTRADRAVTPAIEAYDLEMKVEYERKKIAYEHELKARQMKERALERAYASLTRKVHSPSAGKTEDVETSLAAVERELYELRFQPFANPRPQLRRVLYSSIPMRELERSLCQNWPAAGLISSEAADILNARSDSDMARLDRLWDGQGIDVVGRTARESFSVSDPRLTISLMIQPSVFDRFLERKGEQAKGIGFIPRMLISRPETAYGTRTANNSEPRSTVWLEIFNARVRELLDQGHQDIEKRVENRSTLSFSPAAQQLWGRDHDEKEAQTVEGGDYVYEREFVNRYSEHVARLAALFHFFDEGNPGEHISAGESESTRLQIPEHMVKRAIQISEWYLNEFSQIFHPGKVMKNLARHIFKKLIERVEIKNNGALPDITTHKDGNIRIRANELRTYCTKFNLKYDTRKYKSTLEWLEFQNLIVLDEERVGSAAKETTFVRLVYVNSGGSYKSGKWGPRDFPE